MPEPLRLKKSNCRNCYKCIRHCPLKSIRFSEHQANIIPEECILCGQCFVVCPQNAKEIRNDVASVRRLLRDNRPVIASIAPSFGANYGTDFKSIRKLCLRLGFTDAEETAIGAAIVKDSYLRLASESKQRVFITSCCHTINLLIQKHYPGAIPCLAPVISPMQAHARDLRARFPGAAVVFIGPCISKKDEAEAYEGDVDAVLTFEEFTSWYTAEKLTLEPPEANLTRRNLPEADAGGRSRLFPVPGGILASMGEPPEGFDLLSVDGIENCISAIEDILSGELTDVFIEMSACTGSCIGGPAMDRTRKAPIRDSLIVRRAAGQSDFNYAQLPAKSMEKVFPAYPPRRLFFSETSVNEILKKMGKTSPEHELNCGSCGYGTCRDKARAVLSGKADLTMCLPFLKEKAESFSDLIIQNTPNGIFVLNESFRIQQMNEAAMALLRIPEPADILGEPVDRILDPQLFYEAFQEEKNIVDRCVYLAEYDRYVEETILYDKSYHVLICILRDVTDQSYAREKKEAISRSAVEITEKVIEKQMRTVQEIASLLGETTAETKIALTRLKERIKDE